MTEAPPCCPFCFYSRRLQKYCPKELVLTKNTKGTQATQSKDLQRNCGAASVGSMQDNFISFYQLVSTGINWVDNCALATLKRFEN